MHISRRKFFFFGLAAGVGLLLPDTKITIPEFKFSPDGGDLGRGSILNMHPKQKEFYESLIGYGIPYHESNASTGTWLGLSRSQVSMFRGTR